MKYIITESQFKLLFEQGSDYEPCGRGGNMQIHPADLEFFREFFHVYGFLPYPKEMERLGKIVRIGDVYPEHPVAHLNTKSYYLCKSKVFKEIRMSVAKELGLILADSRSGARSYRTNDEKHDLRSIYEVIFYNIFLMNNEADNLEVDSKKFYTHCGEIQKEVDFIYKDETVIEIAGMVKPEYFDKLNSAMKCIESLGYNTIIYNTREMTRKSSYYEFYEKVCQDFGFPVDEGMRYNVISLIGHNNLSVDTMKDFVDKHIATLKQLSPDGRKKWYQLDKYVRKLYGKGIREYRKDLGIKQNNR